MWHGNRPELNVLNDHFFHLDIILTQILEKKNEILFFIIKL